VLHRVHLFLIPGDGCFSLSIPQVHIGWNAFFLKRQCELAVAQGLVLLTALRHFQINQWRRGQAQKREGGRVLVSLDAGSAETRYAAEPVDNVSPEKLYDRNWALTLLNRALARLCAEYEAEGKSALFERLKPTLEGERLKPSSAVVAAEVGTTVVALRMAVHRLRRRLRELLREEIAPTVANPEDIDDELRHLFASLGNG
jgi:hypothetical protein